MEVGERIRYLRQKSGYTQNALAERAGVAQTHLRRVELGEADITIGYLRLICDALETNLKDFFNVNEDTEEFAAAMSKLNTKQKKILLDFLNSL